MCTPTHAPRYDRNVRRWQLAITKGTKGFAIQMFTRSVPAPQSKVMAALPAAPAPLLELLSDSSSTLRACAKHSRPVVVQNPRATKPACPLQLCNVHCA